jgi:hypothetical protein
MTTLRPFTPSDLFRVNNMYVRADACSGRERLP